MSEGALLFLYSTLDWCVDVRLFSAPNDGARDVVVRPGFTGRALIEEQWRSTVHSYTLG